MLSAVVSILIIWILTGVLVYSAIWRCIAPDFTIDATIMMGTAAAAVVFNLV